MQNTYYYFSYFSCHTYVTLSWQSYGSQSISKLDRLKNKAIVMFSSATQLLANRRRAVKIWHFLISSLNKWAGFLARHL